MTLTGRGNSMTASERLYTEIEQPVAFTFQRMERRGISIDVPYLRSLEAELGAQRTVVEKEIKNELGDINLNSPKQLLEALHAKEITPSFKNKSSTDKRALERLRHLPIVSNLLRYSELDTLLCNFVEPYLERSTDVIHPHFNQCGTRTGRPSCSDPNLLQIPRKGKNGNLVRRMFKARNGKLFGDCDFGQIEPRILAHFSQDSNLCRLFRDGTNFHSYTAEARGIDREKAKVLNLSVGYRATYKSVAQQLQCSDSEAQAEIDGWWSLYPGLWDYQQKLLYDARRTGYVTTLYGRRIKIDGLDDGNKWKREAAERQAINNITQGSAAEVQKLAMIQIDKKGIELLVAVYDSILFEAEAEIFPEDLLTVINCMESATTLSVPLVADAKTGPNWGDLAKFC